MTRKPSARPMSGIYAADLHVLRLYPDGLVLSVFVKPAPRPSDGEVIESWLRRDEPRPLVRRCHYTLDGSTVLLRLPQGSPLNDEPLTLHGTWGADHLVLNVREGTQRQATPTRYTALWLARRAGRSARPR
ncbi:hypothetical protein [Yinghuangia seranimata]|uniref:hypothetical protein n=1 Tax=Yinghuangia seranimata TaxID=408067 RepID=UPI00248D3820|nr:hypothetical protein [Yinghuangia seranimata]MDI2132362.1 hypothetical protein [Yinghuangia seranimata]